MAGSSSCDSTVASRNVPGRPWRMRQKTGSRARAEEDTFPEKQMHAAAARNEEQRRRGPNRTVRTFEQDSLPNGYQSVMREPFVVEETYQNTKIKLCAWPKWQRVDVCGASGPAVLTCAHTPHARPHRAKLCLTHNHTRVCVQKKQKEKRKRRGKKERRGSGVRLRDVLMLSAQGVRSVQQLSCVRCPVCFCAWAAAVCHGASEGTCLPLRGDTRSRRTMYCSFSPFSRFHTPRLSFTPHCEFPDGPQGRAVWQFAHGLHHATWIPRCGPDLRPFTLTSPAESHNRRQMLNSYSEER